MLKYTVILLSFFIGYTQNNIETKSFFRPEFLTGIIPSNNSFNEKPQYVFGVSYAKQHHNTNAWQKYFKKPTTGLSLYITNYSSEKLGYSVSILPFIDIPINKKQNLHAKFAIGSSYFNTKYHAINNPENKQISTNFTWAIQSALYYDFEINKTKNWQVGLVFFHHSNGHTKLPNQGLNSILLGVSTNLLAKKQESTNLKQTNTKGNKFGNFFVAYRFGLGYHSFVDNDSKLKPIYTIICQRRNFI